MNDYNDYWATFYYILIRTTSNKPLIPNKLTKQEASLDNDLESTPFKFLSLLLALFCVHLQLLIWNEGLLIKLSFKLHIKIIMLTEICDEENDPRES